jgi:hypothetical protein
MAEYHPAYDYPFMFRLGQFLLGAGDSLGTLNKQMGTTSALAREQYESDARNDLYSESLNERRRDADLKRQFAEQASTDRTNTMSFLGDLAKQRGLNLPQGTASPQALQWAIEYLSQREKKPEGYTLSEGQTRFDPETNQPLASVVKSAASQRPSTIAPGHGVYDPDTKQWTVPVPEQPKPASDSPSAEKDYHAIARDALGPSATPAAVAAEVRRLAKADQIDVAKNQGAISLGNQMAGIQYRDVLDRNQKAAEADSELAQVDVILDRISAAVPKVNTSGLGGRVAGLTTRKLAEFAQTNPDINELSSLGNGYVSVIAKIVQRQSGILSNQDLERATLSVPLPSDNLEVAQRKVEVLRSILGTARQNIAKMRSGVPMGGSAAPTTTAPGLGAPTRKPDFRYNPATRSLEPVQ